MADLVTMTLKRICLKTDICMDDEKAQVCPFKADEL